MFSGSVLEFFFRFRAACNIQNSVIILFISACISEVLYTLVFVDVLEFLPLDDTISVIKLAQISPDITLVKSTLYSYYRNKWTRI